MLLQKCCIGILLIIFIFLYIYIKKENFIIEQTTTINAQTINAQERQSIGTQLRNEISRLLEISPSRIHNLKYEDDIIKFNVIRVDFDILDNNLTENLQNEITKNEAQIMALNLINNDNFIVRINNKSIIVKRLLPDRTSNEINKTNFFDNKGLHNIVNYTKNKYISVPNDKSLTHFYTLGFDTNYNIVPKI